MEETTPTKLPEPESDSENTPQVYAVSKKEGAPKLTRREFLEVAAITAASVALAGCGSEELAIFPTDTPTPSNTPEPTNTSTPTPTKTKTPTPPPTATKTSTYTPTPIPVAVVRSSANVRFGPSTSSRAVGALAAGDKVNVLGRNDDGTWFRVQKPGGISGWIKATLVDLIDNQVADLRVVTPLPTATNLPGRAGKTAPGATGIDYTYKDEFGIVHTLTLPCGSPLPAGAVCVCNCVTVPVACSCDAYKACTCDQVCTCDTVCSCVGAGHYWYPN